MTEALLTVQGLTKSYPRVMANDDVSFSVAPGEVHALLGENGAGKSTLVKMIYGLVRPDSGYMKFAGTSYAPTTPLAARAAGVAMVFQHFSLFEALNVAENIALGMENPPPQRQLARRIREVSEAFGLPLNPDRRVGELSVGERQRVEVVRCLLQDPKLLIMDEPTSVLTPQEVEILFSTLQRLQKEGTAILYISHKLEEIRTLCDRATVLRDGKVAGGCNPRTESARSMAEMMVGSSLQTPSRRSRKPGDTVLSTTLLSTSSADQFGVGLKDVSLEVRAGELLGIGGVAGNGQDELLAVLSGEMPTARDTVKLHGNGIGQLGPRARRRLGLLAAPEERLGHAAVPDMSLTENALLTAAVREKLVEKGFLRWSRAQAFAERIISTFDVRTPGPANTARSLSGGTLQKFVIGREVLQRPACLVVNQPTWGVDAAAAAAIRQALLDLTAAGAAVIAISQDLDELVEISDRFAALNGGRLSAAQPMTDLTMDEIGLMMGGAHDLAVENAAA